MNPDPPTLHIVYSGRGDAMYIEFHDGVRRQLMIIDGGPRNYKGQGSGDLQLAPYWKYFFSAGKQIWASMHRNDAFAPAAMIATHAHEDHIGGLLSMLRSWKANPGTMVFQGPFVLPRYKTNVDKHVDDVVKVLVTDSAFHPQPGITIPGQFQIVAPPTNQLVCLSAQASQEPAPTWTVIEESSKNSLNHTSILMRTVFLDSNGNQSDQQAFFTADNSALNISETIPAVNPITSKPPHYSVYKIQHHGSGIDSADGYVDIANDSVKELAIFAVLDYPFHKERQHLYDPYLPDNFAPDKDGLEQMAKWIEEEFSKEKPVDLSTRDAIWRCLSDRITLLSGDPSNTGIQWNVQDPAHFYKHFPSVSRRTWRRLISEVKGLKDKKQDEKWKWFWQPRDSNRATTARHPETVLRGWYELWMGGFNEDPEETLWHDYFFGLQRTVLSRQFFSKFTADAYVVSANSDHRHPTPSTLVGLAWAVRRQGKQAQLFVTSAYSINMKMVKQLAKNVQLEASFEELFHHSAAGNNMQIEAALKVFHMHERIYMSLKLEPGHIADRSDGASVLLDFRHFETVYDTYEKTRDSIEKMTKWISRPTMADTWRVFHADTNDKRYVLIMSNTARLVAVEENTAKAMPANVFTVMVQEAWEFDGLQFGKLRLTSSLYNNSKIVDIDKTRYGDCWFIRFDDGGVKRSWFSINDDNNGKTLSVKALSEGEALDYWRRDICVAELSWTLEFAAAPPAPVHGQPPVFMVTNNFMTATLQPPNVTLINTGSSLVTENLASFQRQGMSLVPNTAGNTTDVAADPNKKPFSTFLADSAIENKPMKTRDALVTIITAPNLDSLNYSLKYQHSILEYPTNSERSFVIYTNSSVGCEVSKASLVLDLPSDASITIDKDILKITDVVLTLTWTVDRALTMDILVGTEDGQLLVSRKQNPKAFGSPTLAKVLIGMGYKDHLNEMTLPVLFIIILQDKARV